MTRILSLTGGRDRVGKTSIAVALGRRLAGSGRRVCLLALVRDEVLAGLAPEVGMAATLSDRLSADDCPLVALAQGFDLVIGGDTESWLGELDVDQLERLTDSLQALDDYDYLLIDAGTGSAQNQLAFSLASPELMLVLTPEPAVLSDTYTLLKLLYAEQYAGVISVVVSHAPNPAVGQHAYEKFRSLASHYLDMGLPLAGLVGHYPDFAVTGPSTDDHERADAAGAGLAGLADYVTSLPQADLQVDIRTYGRQLLAAAGPVTTRDHDPLAIPLFCHRPASDALQQQLGLLARQVDELIAEVERLRQQGRPASAAVPPAQPGGERGGRDCIDAIATRSEHITVDDLTFPVYYLRRTDGEELCFACHSIDDDVEEPGPQTRS